MSYFFLYFTTPIGRLTFRQYFAPKFLAHVVASEATPITAKSHPVFILAQIMPDSIAFSLVNSRG